MSSRAAVFPINRTKLISGVPLEQVSPIPEVTNKLTYTNTNVFIIAAGRFDTTIYCPLYLYWSCSPSLQAVRSLTSISVLLKTETIF